VSGPLLSKVYTPDWRPIRFNLFPCYPPTNTSEDGFLPYLPSSTYYPEPSVAEELAELSSLFGPAFSPQYDWTFSTSASTTSIGTQEPPSTNVHWQPLALPVAESSLVPSNAPPLMPLFSPDAPLFPEVLLHGACISEDYLHLPPWPATTYNPPHVQVSPISSLSSSTDSVLSFASVDVCEDTSSQSSSASVYSPFTPSSDTCLTPSSSPPAELPAPAMISCRWAGCTGQFAATQRAISQHFDRCHPLGHQTLATPCQWDGCNYNRPNTRRHISAHIPGVYKCDLCGTNFTRSDRLLHHTRRNICVGGRRPTKRLGRKSIYGSPY
jgi:hypothetical protein